MTKEEMIAQLNAALAEEFEVETEDITPQSSIKDTFHIDSLSLVDMVVLVENMFGVEIKSADVPTIQTFDHLYTYIYDRMNQV